MTRNRGKGGSREEVWTEFRRELDRSRRYERDFCLIRIPCGTAALCAAVEGALASFLRSVDRTWSDRGAVYILLPESDRSTGEALIARIPDRAPEVPIGQGQLAVFPEDGLTSVALLTALVRPGAADVSEVARPRRLRATEHPETI